MLPFNTIAIQFLYEQDGVISWALSSCDKCFLCLCVFWGNKHELWIEKKIESLIILMHFDKYGILVAEKNVERDIR